ncbi:hypothetical protein LSCM1_03029 [Leishmania martiniquensis]|uniref:Ch28 protein n=1 Tax=Leishmania martiniquensis TaxID=1580590 RepID=A0A836HAT1_9TRYP|nr:hypothetical protein LSCM1_03029 [Leishmania martiniquensis]
MISGRIACTESVGSATVLMASSAALPLEVVPEGNNGLSSTTSECSSQPNSRSSRCETRDGPPIRANEGGTIISWMPIIDEEDRQARTLSGGCFFSEDEHQVPPSLCNDEFRRSAYERQVQRWQQDEMAYLKHEGWCEHRLILLIQEAFRCSNNNLKRAFSTGTVSAEVYAARVAGLKNSLLRIKAEYRRTLQRTRDRKGDLPSIASKAVTCIASVYPWSSSGFLIGFEENIKFGQLVDLTGSDGRHGTPLSPSTPQPSVNVAVPSCQDVTSVAKAALPGMRSEHSNSPAVPSLSVTSPCHDRSRATPHVALRPLPPRHRPFQKGTAPDGSPLLSPVRSGISTETISASGPLTVESPNRSFFAASPISLSPKSPVPVPPASVAGPFRSDEQRFLEKGQLFVHGMAFVSHSLASTIFISSRRATIAAATVRRRLAVVTAPAQPPTLYPTPCVNGVDTQPLSPPPAPCTASTSSPMKNAPVSDSGEAAVSTINPSRYICRSVPYPPPFLAPGNGSFCFDPSSRTPVMPSPPAYEQAVASSSEYPPRHLMRLPLSYPNHIRRYRICGGPYGHPSYFPIMSPVSLEEEKHVKELW